MSRNIFVALPSYGGAASPNMSAIINMVMNGEAGSRVTMKTYHSSLLTHGFNLAWVEALNLRTNGRVTHFLMLHNDVQPWPTVWLPMLLGEMDREDADVLSAIVPIKDGSRGTSTAIDTDNKWRPHRLTIEEVLAQPTTWTNPRLLINTGCLLINMTKPWVEQICFRINNQNELVDGKWITHVEPEDWNFSRQCHALGVKVFATRILPIIHWDGRTAYPLYSGVEEYFSPS